MQDIGFMPKTQLFYDLTVSFEIKYGLKIVVLLVKLKHKTMKLLIRILVTSALVC
jgi:hypothetical protein